ncbi:hypothetical protein L1049_007117 [Liquidambar formosana]|uniref:F-box domain-containing protein n=1 Tax=Liquidambar formosana TaxID=63359 RepID=A0AAP0RGS6_LIQFO
MDMGSLPPDIMFEILVRIPATVLIPLKCVCKLWLNLISDRTFADAHFRRTKSQPGIINQRSECDELSYLSLNSDRKGVTVRVYRLSLYPEPYWGEMLGSAFSVLASCNGLLLLGGPCTGYLRLAVCNPITQSSMIIPAPPFTFATYSWALVHDDSIRKYKVICMKKHDIYTPLALRSNFQHTERCYAFTLGCSSSWRWLVTSHQIDSILSVCVSENGKLHWLAKFQQDGKTFKELEWCLYSMDIATEIFKKTPCPLYPRKSKLCLLEMNGSLYCTVGSSEQIGIWVLKDGDPMVWVKHHTIILCATPLCSGNMFVPILMTDSLYPQGTTKLIMWHSKLFFSYDLQSKVMTPTTFRSIFPFFVVHVNSLVHCC